MSKQEPRFMYGRHQALADKWDEDAPEDKKVARKWRLEKQGRSKDDE